MANLNLDEAILALLRRAPASGKALAKALRRDHGRVMAVCKQLAAAGAIHRRRCEVG